MVNVGRQAGGERAFRNTLSGVSLSAESISDSSKHARRSYHDAGDSVKHIGRHWIQTASSELHFNLKSFAIFAGDKRLGDSVTNDLFLVGIPSDIPAKSCGDASQMTGCQHAMVAENVRNRLLPCSD